MHPAWRPGRREALRLFGLTALGLALGRPASLLAGAPPVTASDLGLFRQSRVMMGGIPVTLSVAAERETDANAALNAAFGEMERLEHFFSVYRPDSEISSVNAHAGRRPIAVGVETLALIQDGLGMTTLTEGGFHLALGPAITRWDVLDHPHVPSERELASIRPLIHGGRVQVDASAREVFLTRPGMRLDPGGIGKGVLTERAKQILQQHGMRGGLIVAAGDVIAFGRRPDGAPWRIGVRHPRREGELLASLDLTDTAISTSGDYERFFLRDGVRYHHILDPQTLTPSRASRSVTVISPDGGRADALATGAFVLGPKRGLNLLREQRVQGVIIDDRGGLHVSPALINTVSFNL